MGDFDAFLHIFQFCVSTDERGQPPSVKYPTNYLRFDATYNKCFLLQLPNFRIDSMDLIRNFYKYKCKWMNPELLVKMCVAIRNGYKGNKNNYGDPSEHTMKSWEKLDIKIFFSLQWHVANLRKARLSPTFPGNVSPSLFNANQSHSSAHKTSRVYTRRIHFNCSELIRIRTRTAHKSRRA